MWRGLQWEVSTRQEEGEILLVGLIDPWMPFVWALITCILAQWTATFFLKEPLLASV